MAEKKKIVVAITGASGSIYAQTLLKTLEGIQEQIEEIGVIMSDNAKQVWEHELGNKSYENVPFKFYGKIDFTAPFASGSSNFSTMFICPCSMGTLGRIASGVSDDLISRSADVMLKERRKLILITRDTPLSLVHVNNMKLVTEAGGIICPASPSFYSQPESFEQLAATVTDRALDLAGFKLNTYRWGH